MRCEFSGNRRTIGTMKPDCYMSVFALVQRIIALATQFCSVLNLRNEIQIG